MFKSWSWEKFSLIVVDRELLVVHNRNQKSGLSAALELDSFPITWRKLCAGKD
jgi:hypothetical protein